MSDLAGPLKPLFLNMPPDPVRAARIVSSTPRVKEISEKHKWIVGAMASGFSARDVAKMFDVTPEYAHEVNNWEDPILQRVRQAAYDRAAESIADLGQKFQFHAKEALDRTVTIMRGDDIPNARLAAKDIMDRAGYAPVKKVAEVRTEVPSAEFVAAVERMNNSEEVRKRQAEWAWQPPVKVEPKPEPSNPTGTFAV